MRAQRQDGRAGVRGSRRLLSLFLGLGFFFRFSCFPPSEEDGDWLPSRGAGLRTPPPHGSVVTWEDREEEPALAKANRPFVFFCLSVCLSCLGRRGLDPWVLLRLLPLPPLTVSLIFLFSFLYIKH